jgi:hypothetical protein
MSAWLVVATLSILVFAVFAWLIRQILRPDVPADEIWLDKFSVDRYRPMLRLLSKEDDEFLASECGYSGSQIRKARAERRRIFRAYLKNLRRDFGRLHYAARILLLDSNEDRSDLAAKLVQTRLAFFFGLLVVEYNLALHAAGVGEVDVRGLLGSLEGLQLDCTLLLPARAAAL